MSDVLFIDFDKGMLSIAGRGDIHQESIDSVLMDRKNPTGQSLEEVFYRLASGTDPDYAQFRTLVLDNVTELQKFDLNEVAEEASKKKKRDDLDLLQLQDYGRSTSRLSRLFRGFRDLPLNVIWTAHAKFVYPKGQEGAEAIAITPDLTDKLAKGLGGMVDFVWYYVLEEAEDGTMRRVLVTQPTGIIKVKTRGSKFGEAVSPAVYNPTIPALYDLFVQHEGQ